MNIDDSRTRRAPRLRPAAALSAFAILGSLALPACIDFDDFAPRTSQIPPVEGAIGSRRIPLTEAPPTSAPQHRSNFDSLTFAPEDLGYGPNQHYYLRHDVAQANAAVLGTISSEGTATDRFVIGDEAAVQAFASEHDALSPVVRDLLANSAIR